VRFSAAERRDYGRVRRRAFAIREEVLSLASAQSAASSHRSRSRRRGYVHTTFVTRHARSDGLGMASRRVTAVCVFSTKRGTRSVRSSRSRSSRHGDGSTYVASLMEGDTPKRVPFAGLVDQVRLVLELLLRAAFWVVVCEVWCAHSLVWS